MINADNVNVTFKKGFLKGKVHALNDFSLNIRKGDIFALLGPNGAGKSTAMYCFLGLIKPNSGSIKLFGSETSPGSEIYNQIAYLPEEPHYHQYLTVFEAVKFYTSLYNRDITGRDIKDVLEKLSLIDSMDLKISQCSKGMKQKAGIAVCILSKADLIFLDEPTRGLDPLIVKEFRDILLDMNRKGSTVILNSHILSEVEMTCNYAAIMNKGKVIIQDELSKLVEAEADLYSVEFSLTENIPDYIKDYSINKQSIKGTITPDYLSPFIGYIQESGLTLIQCSQKKSSLEDVFYDLLKQDRSNAQ